VRVTVVHREEHSGLTGAARRYYVDCEVLFSEEEKAIIKARDLSRHHLTVDPPVPPPVAWHYPAAITMRAIAPFLLLWSCIGGLALGDKVGVPMFFLAVGLFAGSFLLKHKTKLAELKTQTIPLRQLLDDPHFTLYALDPSQAKTIDDTVRNKLGRLKHLLVDSIDIRRRETFEL
jgi:hypothetical protein